MEAIITRFKSNPGIVSKDNFGIVRTIVPASFGIPAYSVVKDDGSEERKFGFEVTDEHLTEKGVRAARRAFFQTFNETCHAEYGRTVHLRVNKEAN